MNTVTKRSGNTLLETETRHKERGAEETPRPRENLELVAYRQLDLPGRCIDVGKDLVDYTES